MDDRQTIVRANVLKAAVEDLLNNRQLSVEEAMDRHFSPDFRQCTNGLREDRTAVSERIVQLREDLQHATFVVRDEFCCGNRYAQRHTIAFAMRNGPALALNVYVFAERDADGRFLWIDEAVHPAAVA
ncbi:nuclear transport factor 2 family protein [Xanthomonas sp. WHRI 8932A]|uniref:nuclear transport factor 2 family protein n=1 Tax=unclassified Xanthomonas TaxID=2643310 RepID=UPI002B230798|nr:nuclear transport factor 2 family protein [Xanthomonas sp. WHRI 8932A]MEA9565280.1 nuclear transport factor 2 family protein [Xanthomonas sp. WHRI 8932A]